MDGYERLKTITYCILLHAAGNSFNIILQLFLHT